MSYILDALKKIEHEKNKKPAPDGRVSISGDLFHERTRQPAKTGIWKIVAIIAATSLFAGGGVWFLLQGNNKQPSAVIHPVTPVAVAPVKPLPVVPTPVQPVVPPAPAAPDPVATAPAALITATSVTNKKVETGEDEDEVSSRSSRRSKKPARAQPSSSQPPVQALQAPADIKLSGIAWQEQRSGRRAVINGFLLKEGALVSGAKITDIFANRVRFTSSTGQFEIRLDAVIPAEVKK